MRTCTEVDWKQLKYTKQLQIVDYEDWGRQNRDSDSYFDHIQWTSISLIDSFYILNITLYVGCCRAVADVNLLKFIVTHVACWKSAPKLDKSLPHVRSFVGLFILSCRYELSNAFRRSKNSRRVRALPTPNTASSMCYAAKKGQRYMLEAVNLRPLISCCENYPWRTPVWCVDVQLAKNSTGSATRSNIHLNRDTVTAAPLALRVRGGSDAQPLIAF